MPPTQPNNSLWLANQLADLKQQVAALKAQQTQFIVDASGTAQAIIGNLAADPLGNSTGLSGFGVATWNGSAWVKVPTGLLQVANNLSDLTNVTAALLHLGVTLGTATLNFPNSAQATTITVTHGLTVNGVATAPTHVLPAINGGAGFAAVVSPNIGTITSTTFQLDARSSITLNQNLSVFWLASLI